MKTNKELVKFVQKALKEKWGYCLGSYGNILTPKFLEAKMSQGYGVGAYNTRHRRYLQGFLNKRVSDCYGLVKGFVWWQDDNTSPKYNFGGMLDRNQEGAYAAAKEKGPLNTLPEIPGVILWMKGHAGVYIGNGEFIECVGAPVGMRLGRVANGRITSGSKFTHWFKDTYITYEEGPTEKPVSKPAPKPDNKTTAKGLTEDGYWGPETTKALQKALGTPIDGVISGQYANPITNAITGVTTGKSGSLVVKALQRKIKVKADGFIGPDTVKALQKYLGTPQDGIISKPSAMVKELQRRLNKGTF